METGFLGSVTGSVSGDVKGVVVADQNGLCLAASGTLPSTVAGLASSLVTRAQSLSSEEGDIPAAVIETAEGRRLLVRKDESGQTVVLSC